ncbi:TraC-F-type conjugal transfer protein [Weissella muntiaci]|uniref:TraC-F-type conjugal transfer protein n=1 Tax=Weissella muntiaci TaxID=2508881 RepID=A0A6C2C2J0_9LACO|nr:TraC-F-type conjugal transfer protein [Weissella muntiaci]TYC48002.1 TraC-F-type conjugal transfer protein [Weissella muntiaci]
MSLFKKKKSKKLTVSQIRKQERLRKTAPTTQNTIKYTSQFQNGLMHIVENEYSKMWKLGKIDYEVVSREDQENVAVSYANALNVLDKDSRYQLITVNKRLGTSVLDGILIEPQGDGFDDYRNEMNEIVLSRYSQDQKNFEATNYMVLTKEARDSKQANRLLNNLHSKFDKEFNDTDLGLGFQELDGMDRLKIMNSILRPGYEFTVDYKDMAISGLNSKSFIAPNRLEFKDSYFKINGKFGAVLYIREYPKNLEDRLIQKLTDSGHELVISIHARPYNMVEARKEIRKKQTLNNAEKVRQQKENFKNGISDDMIAGSVSEIGEATDGLNNEFRENGQNLFSGIFTVMLVEDTKDKLTDTIENIKDIGHEESVDFEETYQFQEEALNTILPIGKPYLDIERNYMRDMTTSNVAIEIPFTNVDLQSPTGQYYGQNQMSHNLITVDRKRDLITPSGLYLGSSGSGKSMNVKWGMTTTLLNPANANDKTIIVDPESEYLEIGKEFGAEILDISSGTNNHLNLLDLPDKNLLQKEDQNVDVVKEKANLLAGLFASILNDFTDEEASIVDRVTRLTYERFADVNRTPTLVDWYAILSDQPEDEAKGLYIKVEPYTVGSQNIFAYETNINMNGKFLIFNIKQLDERLKPFAMKVILDQIWKQVVANQNKITTWLYFDELQLNFDTAENADWFWKLWSRVRKYGAVPTGITQNISTLLEQPAGRKMISNSEFLVLLRQKAVDLQDLTKVIKISQPMLKYVGEKVQRGTGLISAGGTVVPFENPIPEDTKLFELMNTDSI